MPDITDDLFAQQPFGVAALAKMAPVPENFRLYSAGWVDDKPEVMRVVGAEFRAAQSGPRKGQLVIIVHGTTRTALVTRAEIEAASRSKKAEGAVEAAQ